MTGIVRRPSSLCGLAARRVVGLLVLLGLLLPALAGPLAAARAGGADCPSLQHGAAHGHGPALSRGLGIEHGSGNAPVTSGGPGPLHPHGPAGTPAATPGHASEAAAHAGARGRASGEAPGTARAERPADPPAPGGERPAGAAMAEGCGPAACCPADLADGLLAPPAPAARAERGFGLAHAALPAPGDERDRPPRLP
jgi:hypothetical protein